MFLPVFCMNRIFTPLNWSVAVTEMLHCGHNHIILNNKKIFRSMKLLCIFCLQLLLWINYCALYNYTDIISSSRECFQVLCWLHCWIVWVLFKFWSSSTRILLKSFQGEVSIGKATEFFQSRVIVFWILQVLNSVGCFFTCGLSTYKYIQDCLCTSIEVAEKTQDMYVNYFYALDSIQNIFHSNVWT